MRNLLLPVLSCTLIMGAENRLEAGTHLDCRYYEEDVGRSERSLEIFEERENLREITREFDRIKAELDYRRTAPDSINKKISGLDKEIDEIETNRAATASKIRTEKERADKKRDEARQARSEGKEKKAKELEQAANEIDRENDRRERDNVIRTEKIQNKNEEKRKLRHELEAIDRRDPSTRQLERDLDELQDRYRDLLEKRRILKEAVDNARSTLELCRDFECQSESYNTMKEVIAHLQSRGCDQTYYSRDNSCGRKGFEEALRAYGCY